MIRSSLIAIAVCLAFNSTSSVAANILDDELSRIKNIKSVLSEKGSGVDNLRYGAIKSAALAYGAQVGLKARTNEINTELMSRADVLNEVYDFSSLMIDGPSGILIAPPIVIESSKFLKISDDGLSASLAERVYKLIKPAYIKTAPSSWREYLIRSFDKVDRPSEIVLPKNEKEQNIWASYVETGYQNGLKQAEEIFEYNLAKLQRDLTGSIRYLSLLEEGKVKDLYIGYRDKDTIINDNIMTVGNRAIRIIGNASFNGDAATWRPIIIHKEPYSPVEHKGQD